MGGGGGKEVPPKARASGRNACARRAVVCDRAGMGHSHIDLDSDATDPPFFLPSVFLPAEAFDIGRDNRDVFNPFFRFSNRVLLSLGGWSTAATRAGENRCPIRTTTMDWIREVTALGGAARSLCRLNRSCSERNTGGKEVCALCTLQERKRAREGSRKKQSPTSLVFFTSRCCRGAPLTPRGVVHGGR